MSDLIERYVNEVVCYLPIEDREDIKEELMASILEQVQDENDEDEIKEVLKMFGHPRLLSGKYRNQERYLIGPDMFDSYLNAIKMGLLGGFAISVLATVGKIIADIISGNITATENGFIIAGRVLGSLLNFSYNICIVFVFWITIGFFIYERYAAKKVMDEWDPKDLPELKDQEDIEFTRGKSKNYISRVETIVEMALGTIFFGFFLYSIMSGFDWVISSNAGIHGLRDIFNTEVFKSYLMVFTVGLVVSLIVDIGKLVFGRWNIPLIIGNAISQILSIVILSSFLLNNEILKPGILNLIHQNSKYTLEQVTRGFANGKLIFIAIVIVIAMAEIITSIYKYAFSKHQRIKND
jgi:hypothetical protein